MTNQQISNFSFSCKTKLETYTHLPTGNLPGIIIVFELHHILESTIVFWEDTFSLVEYTFQDKMTLEEVVGCNITDRK